MTNAIYHNLDGSIGQDITDLGNSFVSATVSGGGITYSATLMSVDTEGGAASDELDTIADGGTGKLLLLRSQSTARIVTLRHDVGNLWNPAGGDVVLTHPNKLVMLIYNSARWIIMNAGGELPGLSAGCLASESVILDCRTGATVTTSMITQTGKTYRLTISGNGVMFNGSPTDYGDAFYTSRGGWGAPSAFGSPGGFQLNGANITPPPAYRADHTYQVILSGTGAALSLRFYDTVYTDNSNWTLSVVICQLN
jgi:hypothetical protein